MIDLASMKQVKWEGVRGSRGLKILGKSGVSLVHRWRVMHVSIAGR